MTENNNSNDTQNISSQNNKALLVGAICILAGGVGGYYVNEHRLLAKPSDQASASSSLNDTQRAEVEAIAKKVITDNPDLVMTSLQGMQEKMRQKQMEVAAKGLKEYKADLYNENSPAAGAESPVVTVVEFFDYHCGYCKKVTPVIRDVLAKNKDVRVIFKEFPILSPDSRNASRAALAVWRLKPEKYFEYHQMMMDHRAEYSIPSLQDYASKIGVDGKDLEKEMNSDWVNKELEQVASLAQKLALQGTPAIIVGEELIPGAVDYDGLNFRITAARDLANGKAKAE